MQIGGLPLHFLVVHAAVVFTPLAALAALVFAAVPRWRWLARWPSLALGLVSLVTVFVAKTSGEEYLEAHEQLEPIVEDHAELGELLLWVTLAFAVVLLVASFVLSSRTPLPSGRGARDGAVPALEKPLALLLVIAAVAVIVVVVLTGDAGARAVWG
ncbi:MAG TPA: DUF2231 domain-containing protein [Nocardioidaceae bacterium]|jgi:hypothetical protein|nr:DUF2231 domain-containing protein [Nocardioidaceae bacterium]